MNFHLSFPCTNNDHNQIAPCGMIKKKLKLNWIDWIELNIGLSWNIIRPPEIRDIEKRDASSEFRGCVKVEVAVLGSRSLIELMLSVDVEQHWFEEEEEEVDCRAQDLCESRGGRPGLPVLNRTYALCGRKATLIWRRRSRLQSSRAVYESRGGRPGLPIPNSPYGLCGCKAALNLKTQVSRNVEINANTTICLLRVFVISLIIQMKYFRD